MITEAANVTEEAITLISESAKEVFEKYQHITWEPSAILISNQAAMITKLCECVRAGLWLSNKNRSDLGAKINKILNIEKIKP